MCCTGTLLAEQLIHTYSKNKHILKKKFKVIFGYIESWRGAWKEGKGGGQGRKDRGKGRTEHGGGEVVFAGLFWVG
jgi:hypothetical protein